MSTLRQTLRALLRSPRYSLTVVVTLGIALAGADTLFLIGAPTLLHPLPFPDSDRLYEVRVRPEEGGPIESVSHPAFRLMRDAVAPQALLGAYRSTELTLTDGAAAEAVPATIMTSGLAEALSVRLSAGRTFSLQEDAPGGPAVAIVGRAFARSRWGVDPSGALERRVEIAGESHEVIGVLADSQGFPTGSEIWVPLQNDDMRRGDRFRFLTVIARANPGVTGNDLREGIARSAPGIGSPEVRPLTEAVFGEARSRLAVLAVAVLGALLVASINLGALTWVRALSRAGERVVRLALGASRMHIARGIALEVAVLTVAASLLAGALVVVLLGAVRSWAPPEITSVGGPGGAIVLLGGGATLGLLSTLCASAVPLLMLPTSNVASALRQMGTAQRTARASSILLATQGAVSLVLCASSLTLVRTFAVQHGTGLGFEQSASVEFRVVLSTSKYRSPEARVAFLDELEQRLESLPGVSAVGASLGTPLSTQRMRTSATTDGGARRLGDVSMQPASVGWRNALGRELVEGRDLEASDGPDHEPVALVNASLARATWPEGSALGRKIKLDTEPGGFDGERTVVGVLRDVRTDLHSPPPPEVVVPYSQAAIPSLTFVIRSAGAPPVTEDQVRLALASLDQDLPVRSFMPVAAHRDRILRAVKLQVAVLGGFAVLSLILVLISVYSVTTSMVERRRSELGVRLALGCEPLALGSLVLGWGLKPISYGLVAGALVSSLWIEPVLAASIPGAGSVTLSVVAASTLVLFGTVMLSVWSPARSAGRMSVARALLP